MSFTIARREHFVIWGVAFVALLPALLFGFSISTHDGTFHSIMMRGFTDQILQGDPYPRWNIAFNGGAGSPAFYFYNPLPYVLGVPFAWLKPVDPYGGYRLAIAFFLSFVLSGYSCRAWLRRLTDKRNALRGAVMYMVIPFHLAIDTYVRGAYSQTFAYIWFPLLLLAVLWVIEDRLKGLLLLAVSAGGLILSNVPTTLMYIPFVGFYALFAAAKGNRLRSLMWTALGLALGPILAAVYLLPLFAHRSFVNLTALSAGDLGFARHLIFATNIPPDFPRWSGCLMIGLLVLSWLAFKGAGLSWKQPFGRADKLVQPLYGKNTWFGLAAMAVVIVITSSLSTPFWRAVEPFHAMQLPFRFMLVGAIVFPVLLLPLCMQKVDGSLRNKRIVQGAVMFNLAAWLSMSIYYVVGNYRAMVPFGALNQLNRAHPVISDPGEYRTIWQKPLQFNDSATIGLWKDIYQSPGMWHLLDGEGSVEIERLSNRDILLRPSTTSGMTIEVEQIYFPGWETDEGLPQPEPTPGSGLTTIVIPPGVREMHLRLVRSPQEQIGAGLSIAMGLLLLAGTLYWRKHRPLLREHGEVSTS